MVNLLCVREGNKLRVRITSPGYNNWSNCQFPKDIRIEGCRYTCQPEHITLALIGSKYFYRIRKYGINVCDGEPIEESVQISSDFKIYTDESCEECSICLTNIKALVYVPCGHFISCRDCDSHLTKRTCPICRVNIINTITPDQIG